MERRDSGAGDRRLVRGLLPSRQPSSPVAPAVTGPVSSSEARRPRDEDRPDAGPADAATGVQPGPIPPRTAQPASRDRRRPARARQGGPPTAPTSPRNEPFGEAGGQARPPRQAAARGASRDPAAGDAAERTRPLEPPDTRPGAASVPAAATVAGPPPAPRRRPTWWSRRPVGQQPARPADAGPLPRLRGLLGLVALCLVLAAVILGLSWLVGGLDVVAGGAVLGAWSLCVAARVILGRPGTDWTVPTFDQVLAAGLDEPDERRPPERWRRRTQPDQGGHGR